jgi:hypothetical protein
MTEEVEGTFDKLKAGAKAVATKVTNPHKDLGAEYEKEKFKEMRGPDYENKEDTTTENTDAESKEPMSPEKIVSHEPTAVKRDKNQGSSGEPV